jgi:microcystin degradation protein MlrC
MPTPSARSLPSLPTSAQHFYNGFVGLAKEILYVASPGAADPDVTRWPYTKRKTPFWPKVSDPWK